MNLLFVLALLGAAPAADGPAGPPDLADRISLDLVDAAPGEVFHSFGELIGCGDEMAPEVTTPVTIRLRGVSVRTSLDAVCETVGCSWSILRFREAGESGAPRHCRLQVRAATEGSTSAATPEPSGGTSPLDETISIRLSDAAFPDVLSSFGRMLKAEVTVDPSLAQAKVSAELPTTTVRAALDEICRRHGCRWAYAPGPPARLVVDDAP
jgi:hypothetical protein